MFGSRDSQLDSHELHFMRIQLPKMIEFDEGLPGECVVYRQKRH